MIIKFIFIFRFFKIKIMVVKNNLSYYRDVDNYVCESINRKKSRQTLEPCSGTPMERHVLRSSGSSISEYGICSDCFCSFAVDATESRCFRVISFLYSGDLIVSSAGALALGLCSDFILIDELESLF